MARKSCAIANHNPHTEQNLAGTEYGSAKHIQRRVGDSKNKGDIYTIAALFV